MADNPKIASYPSALAVANEPVRFFLNTAVQQAVSAKFASLPAGSKGAWLGVQGDDGHVAVVLGSKLSDHWSVGFAYDKMLGSRKGEGDKYEADVLFSWE